ncbi:MAG: acyl carrier protein [Clostridia bacterium]|nr:acyl carrier protein [Clostridia bacterium]
MFEQIKELILNYVDVDPETITEESRFIEDLGFTSYDFMSMLGEVEEIFGVQVEEEAVTTLSTISDAIKYFESLK